jgi:SAM-dependent methyltransferase
VSAVAGDTVLQSRILEDLASASRYRSWIVSMVATYASGLVLEIGSGTGDVAADLAASGVLVTASEADRDRLAALHRRFSDGPVQVRELQVPIEQDGDYATVVAVNVLEHVPDDVGALRAFRRLLRPGGRVVLFVPAFEFAMSRFDEEIGHQRRYRAATLRDALEGAGFVVERVHYVNSLGLLAWVVGMRLFRMRPSTGPALRVWDSTVVPILRRVESRWRPPFGQSVFAVARNPVT